MTTTIPLIDTGHLRGLPDDERDAVIARVSAALEGASAKDIAAWAVRSFGRDLIVAASMQDTILPHLFQKLIQPRRISGPRPKRSPQPRQIPHLSWSQRH